MNDFIVHFDQHSRNQKKGDHKEANQMICDSINHPEELNQENETRTAKDPRDKYYIYIYKNEHCMAQDPQGSLKKQEQINEYCMAQDPQYSSV